jgi:hypothetical protein
MRDGLGYALSHARKLARGAQSVIALVRDDLHHARNEQKELIRGVQEEIELTRSGTWRWEPDATDSRQYVARSTDGRACRWLRRDNGRISLGTQDSVVENTYASQLLTRQDATGAELDRLLHCLWQEATGTP